MAKTIKEIREIKSKVKIIREIEREKDNNNENNFNEFLEIDRLRFLNARKKTLNKNKAGEKLDGIIDDESIKDENKAREDLERNRGNVDDRNNEPRNIYSRNEDNSVYKVNLNKDDNSVVRYSSENRGDNVNVGIVRGNENRNQESNESKYLTSSDNPRDSKRKKAWELG